jgi:hypothetical protein
MMKCQADIEKLAKQKLAAARCLLDAGLFDDAYYIAGYSIELYLKAMICKTLGVDNFFNFDKTVKKDLYRAYKNHNYADLLLLSGIYNEYETAIKETDFKSKWSVVDEWSENSRYVCDKKADEVRNFLNLAEEICVWIQKHL